MSNNIKNTNVLLVGTGYMAREYTKVLNSLIFQTDPEKKRQPNGFWQEILNSCVLCQCKKTGYNAESLLTNQLDQFQFIPCKNEKI